ncbi:MAG: tRNA (N(6)-L-threonylcarbamoyladenosine(37)-C(2))-methylthiotransferase MtaB, partial [Candidatus Omnitrophica bacterium]|nr:tRNA (N(6)-L-threonylcarbamoyladenosine(37)-C(2))-methylthiotransferase MtaB [Candidatus Omnitrophota bacterium]
RENIPSLSITTDIIVGFPGETEENFKNTLEFLKEIQPLRVHIFAFSFRKGTSFFAEKSIAEPIIKKRIKILKELTDELSLTFRKRFLGQKLRVVVEKKPDSKSALYKGYTDNYIKVLIDTKEYSSELHSVVISEVKKEFTFARLL